MQVITFETAAAAAADYVHEAWMQHTVRCALAATRTFGKSLVVSPGISRGTCCITWALRRNLRLPPPGAVATAYLDHVFIVVILFRSSIFAQHIIETFETFY